MIYKRTSLLCILWVIFYLNLAFSQNTQESPFELKTGREAAIIGVGAAMGIMALVIMSNTGALTDEEISLLKPENVSSFDRIAIGTFGEDKLGDALLYGSYILPLTFLTYDESRENFGTLALMYGEVILLNAGLNGIVKSLTARSRPYVYDPNSIIEKKYEADARYSFYSGHTSMTASNSFFTAKVFSEYLTSSTTKTLIWVAAALIPAVTGFSRVNTHNHFPTDVIVGYIVGAAIGYLIPELHKYENTDVESVTPAEFVHKPIIGFQISF